MLRPLRSLLPCGLHLRHERFSHNKFIAFSLHRQLSLSFWLCKRKWIPLRVWLLRRVEILLLARVACFWCFIFTVGAWHFQNKILAARFSAISVFHICFFHSPKTRQLQEVLLVFALVWNSWSHSINCIKHGRHACWMGQLFAFYQVQ